MNTTSCNRRQTIGVVPINSTTDSNEIIRTFVYFRHNNVFSVTNYPPDSTTDVTTVEPNIYNNTLEIFLKFITYPNAILDIVMYDTTKHILSIVKKGNYFFLEVHANHDAALEKLPRFNWMNGYIILSKCL